jgi:transposase
VHGEYDVFLGLDVGKGEHHAVGLAPGGKRLHDAPLPNTEARLRALFDKLGRHGRLLVVVDQPASIGALPVAVARACGHQVAYLPGLAMRRIADLHPGTAKTDARDAYVIADAARTLPHTLRRVDAGDDALAELEMLVGYDDDLAGEATRVSNRIRGLLTQIHPAVERVLGPKVTHPAVLELLSRCGGPVGLGQAGHAKLTEIAVAHAPRMGANLVEQILAALGEQTVTVPGSHAAETILPRLANTLREVLRHRDQVATEVEGMLDAHPLAKVLTSMPGIGVRTGARILLAGLAPVTRRSGSSIRGEHPPKGGNKQLKRAFFLAAFAALADPASRTYYDRKRAEGKKHNAALICLARRRVDVLHAMLRTKTTYRPKAAPDQAAA